jgi:hypothetical protein
MGPIRSSWLVAHGLQKRRETKVNIETNDAERTACPVCIVATLTAERDQLRAELATERARLDWLDENAGDIHRRNSNRYIIFASQDLRAAIDAAMKEGAK